MSAAAPSPAPAWAVALVDEVRGTRTELRAIREALERNAPGASRAALDPDELLRVRPAALENGVDVKSLRSAIALGKVPAANAGKRLTRVRRGDVLAWLAGRRGKRGAA